MTKQANTEKTNTEKRRGKAVLTEPPGLLFGLCLATIISSGLYALTIPHNHLPTATKYETSDFSPQKTQTLKDEIQNKLKKTTPIRFGQQQLFMAPVATFFAKQPLK